MRVLHRSALTGLDAEPSGRLEVDVRRGLAAGHLLRRDRHANEVGTWSWLSDGLLEEQIQASAADTGYQLHYCCPARANRKQNYGDQSEEQAPEAEELGAGGTMQDLTMSSDSRVVGALVDARRAVLFTLP